MQHPVAKVELSGGQTLRVVVTEPIEVGRDCDGLILRDSSVSRRHLLLEPGPADGTLSATDLGSSNGTFRDGVRLASPTVLKAGEGVTLGESRISVVDPIGLPGMATSGATHTVIDRGPAATSIDRVAAAVNSSEPTPSSLGESGTLTIVFSDIENSTAMAGSLGDARWVHLLETHARKVEERVQAAEGRVIKNQGDGFMMAFRSARNAILASIAIQRDLNQPPDGKTPIRVRIGMHTGEGLMDERGDIFGHHVNKAARVGSLAEGGQIWVSDLVRAITVSRGDLRFGDPVQAMLKGIAEPAIVHELLWER